MSHELNDDPKLTAYALGEMNAADRAEMEARLATDDAARAEVQSIRALAGRLTEDLREEAASEPLKLPRRTRWAERLAVAAAACVVIGGSVAVLLPAMSHARYSSNRILAQQQAARDVAARQGAALAGSSSQSARSAVSGQVDV